MWATFRRASLSYATLCANDDTLQYAQIFSRKQRIAFIWRWQRKLAIHSVCFLRYKYIKLFKSKEKNTYKTIFWINNIDKLFISVNAQWYPINFHKNFKLYIITTDNSQKNNLKQIIQTAKMKREREKTYRAQTQVQLDFFRLSQIRRKSNCTKLRPEVFEMDL